MSGTAGSGTAARTRRDLRGALANGPFRVALGVSLAVHLCALALVRWPALPEQPRRVIRLLIVHEEPPGPEGAAVTGAVAAAASPAAAGAPPAPPRAARAPAPESAPAEPQAVAAAPVQPAPLAAAADEPPPVAAPETAAAPAQEASRETPPPAEAARVVASASPVDPPAEALVEGTVRLGVAAGDARVVAAGDPTPGGVSSGGPAASAPALPAAVPAAGGRGGAGEGATAGPAGGGSAGAEGVVTASGGVAGADGVGGSGGATGAGASGPPDLSGVRRRIDARKVYPPIAVRNGWEGRVLVEMRLELDGRLAGVRLVEGSGYAVLDQATITAVRLASPFPPVARVVQVPVEYRLIP